MQFSNSSISFRWKRKRRLCSFLKKMIIYCSDYNKTVNHENNKTRYKFRKFRLYFPYIQHQCDNSFWKKIFLIHRFYIFLRWFTSYYVIIDAIFIYVDLLAIVQYSIGFLLMSCGLSLTLLYYYYHSHTCLVHKFVFILYLDFCLFSFFFLSLSLFFFIFGLLYFRHQKIRLFT